MRWRQRSGPAVGFRGNRRPTHTANSPVIVATNTRISRAKLLAWSLSQGYTGQLRTSVQFLQSQQFEESRMTFTSRDKFMKRRSNLGLTPGGTACAFPSGHGILREDSRPNSQKGETSWDFWRGFWSV